MIYRQLKNFLDKNDILFKSQYGFREKHTTQHAVIGIVNILQNNMDLKLFTCGIFLDLKKAFDTVNHSSLLKKLNHYGIRGIINHWFSSYLLSRSQVTEIEYRSDDVIKMKFVKLWDLLRYSERTTSKTPTRQKLAIRAKLSLRY